MKRPLAFAALLLPLAASGQGSLTPPAGAPAPNMKTLQEIWNKVGTLETQLTQTQTDLTSARADITRLRDDNKQLSSLLALSPAGEALPWLVTTIATGGQYNSLAFGPDGYPAVSHYSATSAILRFSRYNGSTWTTTNVDTNTFVGTYSSLAFAPGGQPAIAYYDATNTNLKYARYNGTTWAIETVDNNAGNVGQHASLGFNGDGRAVIAYYDATNGDLKIARHNGAFFELSTVDSTGDVGKACSLAIGPDGQPAIAYYNAAAQQFKFARYNGSSWIIAQAGMLLGNLQGNFSLAFDPTGMMSTPVFDGSHLFMTFANSNTIGVASNGGESPAPGASLAYGPDGAWMVSFRDLNYDHRLTVSTANGVTVPTLTVVDDSYHVGQFSSIAFGPDGQPAIAYYDEFNGSLKFARRGIFKPMR